MFKAIAIGLFAGYLLHFVLRQDNAFMLFSALIGSLIGAVSHLSVELNTLKSQLRTEATPRPGSDAAQTRTHRRQTATARQAESAEREDAVKTGEQPDIKSPQEVRGELSGERERAGADAGNVNAVDYLVRYLSGGNPLVRIGGVLFFFGMAFLAKYAAENSLISIEFRLIAIALFAAALIVTGWKLRSRPGQYGLIVQGVGIAMLYLVIFSSAKLYTLMPLNLAFVLMLATVMSGAVLALRQESLPLMLFATAGGFLVPILTSSGGGSHIALFSYYTLLNAGIVAVAWYRAWRVLNVTGFLFTFVIATAWGVLSYRPELLASTEPFLILFFFFYLMITLLFTYRQPLELRGFIDPTLVFGVPLAAFALQNALVKEIEYALSFTALCMGGIYLLLAQLLWRRRHMRLLSEAFIALSAVFVTLAVPYALDGHWTAATWSLEAAAIIWIGLRQKRYYARLFGSVLQIGAGVLFFLVSLGDKPQAPFYNGLFLGGITVASAALLSAWLYTRAAPAADPKREQFSAPLFLGIGVIWWLLSGMRDVRACCDVYANGMLLYISASAALFALVAHLSKWEAMLRTLQGFFVLGLLYYMTLLPHLMLQHPFEGIGFFSFAAFFTLHYLLLYRYEEHWQYPAAWHVAGLWLLAAIVSRELAWQIETLGAAESFVHMGYAIAPLLLGLLVLLRRNGVKWPLRVHAEIYRTWALGGLAVALLLWEFKAMLLDADPSPLPYLPLLNPLELLQCAVAVSLGYWWLRSYTLFGLGGDVRRLSVTLFGIFALLLMTVVLARSVHVFAAVPYRFDILWGNALFQTALSLLWGIAAFAVIWFGKHLAKRAYWIAGAVLLGIVIAKLFLVDLSNSATLERIVSFSAVGALVLLIGYIAPLPPKEEKEAEAVSG